MISQGQPCNNVIHTPNRRNTYNHITTWLTDARNLTHPNTVFMLVGLCIICLKMTILGNKCDIEDQRDVSYQEAEKFAQENGLIFVEASAKT